MDTALNFFQQSYKALRPPHTPMKWMKRMFLRLINGEPPSLVDLITGAGKTDLIVIWLIALAWYAQNRSTAKPVPRRLVWVVNRRVLVQQVDEMAQKLGGAFKSQSGPVAALSSSLRSLCRQDVETVFNVVQLRGQRLDDREWSLDPTRPQLIIGTVDQIGSRLLFQGYGQGKWARPMHASLLGVDAWVCVDEAHLVPAFAVTLRQAREIAARPLSPTVPEVVRNLFEKLPFWITELSATPGLPRPRHSSVFTLEPEDETDEVIADRLLAKQTRHVLWKPQPEKKHLARDMAAEALQIAKDHSGSAIAVFCRTANDANKIGDEIKRKHEGRVQLVTGRIRGYERDRLSAPGGLFDRFRAGHAEAPAADTPPTFLVGTAAAEVGLDADSSAIVCDLASLPTLIQRLGRLDRRGQLSKQARDQNTPPPTMTIVGGSNGRTTETQLRTLAERITSAHPTTDTEYGAEFFVGSPWSVVVGKEKIEADEDDDSSASQDDGGGAKHGTEDAVASATWKVLALPTGSSSAKQENPLQEQPEQQQAEAATGEQTPPPTQGASGKSHSTSPSSEWLTGALASITAGPVVVPPLTDAVLQRWAATTSRPSKYLPVHPWLYGLLPDEEGTPLVGIAFRLEIDILQHCRMTEEDDGDTDHTWEKINRCLDQFPPLRSELHLVPLGAVRKWLDELPGCQCPVMAHFDGDEWTDAFSTDSLGPNSVLVLPTSTDPKLIREVIPPGGGESNETQRCWDVFEWLAAKGGAKYRREIIGTLPRIRPSIDDKGTYRVPDSSPEDEASESAEADSEAATNTPEEEPLNNIGLTKWKASGCVLEYAKNGIQFKLRYFSLKHGDGTVRDLLPDHLSAAAKHGGKLAEALAPGNELLKALLSCTGKDHDIGKDHAKWQQTMGNTRAWREKNTYDESVRIAKPVIENPSHAGGYRHEWGTLWRINDALPSSMPELDEHSSEFVRDWYLHSIAAHHGYFRPSMPDRGFDSPPTAAKQNPLRLAAIERFARLQRQLGYWRLAYLESLLKVADLAASRDAENQTFDDES